MPIYEYECKNCEHCFEAVGKHFVSKEGMTINTTPSCPKCNGDTKKIISASNFQLKGGGWASSGYSKEK